MERDGVYFETIDIYEVYKLFVSVYFVSQSKSLKRSFLQLVKVELKWMYLCCLVWIGVVDFFYRFS
jgi:hypothetical protein